MHYFWHCCWNCSSYSSVTHRMLEPGVLDDWTHLLVHHHILQILQGGMLAYFILKWQHVLTNCSCKGTARQQSGKCYAEEENTAVLWLLKIQHYLKSNFIHIAALPFICFADKTKTNLYWAGVKQCDLFTYGWRRIPSPCWLTICVGATRHQLPQHQAHSIHVYPQEGVSLKVDGSLQHLWGHVTPRTHLDRQWIWGFYPLNKQKETPTNTCITEPMQTKEKTSSEVITYLSMSIPRRFSWLESYSKPKVTNDCS